MPIYEYKCQKCQGVIDSIRKIEEMDKPIECPKCSVQIGYAVYAERIVSAPSGQFPGASGWQK